MQLETELIPPRMNTNSRNSNITNRNTKYDPHFGFQNTHKRYKLQTIALVLRFLNRNFDGRVASQHRTPFATDWDTRFPVVIAANVVVPQWFVCSSEDTQSIINSSYGVLTSTEFGIAVLVCNELECRLQGTRHVYRSRCWQTETSCRHHVDACRHHVDIM